MSQAIVRKTLEILSFLLKPRASLSCLRRGRDVKDPVYATQTYWFQGELPRVPICQIFPTAIDQEVILPRALDRSFGTSMTAEEACQLCAIVRTLDARNILEIGTFDGNTTVALAANIHPEGRVVTLDLPPDFDPKTQKVKLLEEEEQVNLTPRNQLGRQLKLTEHLSKIYQVYGDSATINWETLGGPFDLAFIDGCHTAQYVLSDSRNALKHVRKGGAIVWHDYGMTPDVSMVVDGLSRELPSLQVRILEGTRLAVGLV